MTDREIAEKLVREVMAWLGEQRGMPELQTKQHFDQKDFEALEAFLGTDFSRRNELKDVHGYVSAKSLQRFWQYAAGKDQTEADHTTARNVLSALALHNRWLVRNISIRYTDTGYPRPEQNLWQRYQALHGEQQTADKPELRPPENNSGNKSTGKNWRTVLPWCIVLVLVSSLCMQKAGSIAVGEKIAEWDVYFRMRDTNLLWTFGNFTFYKPLYAGENTYIVEASGLYRKKTAPDVIEPDETFKHRGTAKKIENFLHINLTPTDNENYNKFGPWNAVLHLGSLEIMDTTEYFLGFGGGISGYQGEQSIKRATACVLFCKHPGKKMNTHEIIGRMMKCVTDEALEAKENDLTDTAALKQHLCFQRLRTNFEYREPEKQ